MPRVPGAPGGRTRRACTALSDEEMADLDERRGPLDVSQFLRYLIVTATKEHDIHFGKKKNG